MEEKKKPIGLIIGAVIICIIVIAVICVIIVLLRSKSSKSTQTDEKETANHVILLSQEEAEELIEEYYDIAETLWFLSNDEYDIDNSKYPEPLEIRNYEEVIDKYISENYKNEFKPALLIENNGKYYIQISGFAEGYNNLKFENIKVTENKISCKVSFSLYVGDELVENNVTSDFVLVLEDDEWKIAEYYSDYMIHYMKDPEEVQKIYEKNEVIELDSEYGKEIEEFLNDVWVIPEVYSECIVEFQNIKSAPKAYLAACSAFKAWKNLSNSNNRDSTTMKDFNNALVELFGEEADGLLNENDMEAVFFLSKNDDGTYRFMGFDGSETSDTVYNIENIERKNNIFYVYQYEYKTELSQPLIGLSEGEGVWEYVYNRKNELIATLIIRAIINGKITSYVTYDQSGNEIGKAGDVKEYILSHFSNSLSVRCIVLELEDDGSFIMLSNKYDENSKIVHSKPNTEQTNDKQYEELYKLTYKAKPIDESILKANYEIVSNKKRVAEIFSSTNNYEYIDVFDDDFFDSKNLLMIEGLMDPSIVNKKIDDKSVELLIYEASPLMSIDETYTYEMYMIPIEKTVDNINYVSQCYPDRVY